MISNTTVTDKRAKSDVLKITGHEKSKVTVTLAAKANGDKLKSHIVFPGHKHEEKKRFCNQKLLLGRINYKWLDEWGYNHGLGWECFKTFTFGKRRLFVWDSFRAHLIQSVKELLNKGKIDPVVIPGGATRHIQVADESWNKPIKDQLRETYDQWMDEGPHTHIKGGNMRGPPLKQIVQWVLKAWSDLNKKIIIK